MIKFTDPFERQTIIEVLPSPHNQRIGFVLRKERQSIYESWDLDTAKKLTEELKEIIQLLENNNG